MKKFTFYNNLNLNLIKYFLIKISKKIENIISTNIKNLPSIVHIKDEIKRETPPAELKTDNIELAKWYVNAILELRKDLMTYGTKYEEYYIEKARVFININDEIKKELLHLH